MNRFLYPATSLLVLILTTAFSQPAAAQQSFSPHQIDLYQLIGAAAAETGKEIVYNEQLVTNRAGVASTAGGDADYETLLAALRTIGYVAIESDDQIRIVNDAQSRTEPTLLLQRDDNSVSNHAIVTRVIDVPEVEVETADGVLTMSMAPQLVPILRPMLSTNAQLGAVQGANQLIIVDRYDNVRRITAVVNEIIDGL